MQYKIFLVCVLFTGCTFADSDVTSEATEVTNPEATLNPESPVKDGEATTVSELKDVETSTSNKEDKATTLKNLSLKSDQNNSGEHTTNPSSGEGSSDQTKSHIDSTVKYESTTSARKDSLESSAKKDGSDKSSSEEDKEKSKENSSSQKEVSPLPHKPNKLSNAKLSQAVNSNPSTESKGADISDKTAVTPAKPTEKPIDVPLAIGTPTPKPIADHKMTPTEQQAYLRSLDQMDLCPMSVDVSEQVGIVEAGANTVCKDLAATMGYTGFCAVLMKTDPETGDPIYTRTCAYFDPKFPKKTCTTNFLTTTPVANATQVKYSSENGITNYIPTSCVKKPNELVLP